MPSQRAGLVGDPTMSPPAQYVPVATVGPPQFGQQAPLLQQPDQSKPTHCDRCRDCCCSPCCCVVYLVVILLVIFFTYKCRYLYVDGPPPSAKVLPSLGGRDTFFWWDMPVQRSEEQLEWCKSQLRNPMPLKGLQYGFLPGAAAPEVLYRCTKVPGIFENVPEQFRGVFWMKDNAMNEELAVLQFGRWFENERVYVMPASPFSWAWAGVDGTTPANAPFEGRLYGEWISKYHMDGLAGGHQSQSYAFAPCPGAPELPWPWAHAGHRCPAGTGNPPELTYAELNAHYWGDLSKATQDGLYTLEYENPNAWYRGIYGPVPVVGNFFKGCNCFSIGSYNLRRIIDANGNPVEPYHSEWLAYIGQANLAVWYDYTDPAALELLKQGRLEDGKDRMWESYCGENPKRELC